MAPISLLSLSILAMISLASAASLSMDPSSPLAGYGVEPIGWQISASSGHPPMDLAGTIEEVISQLFDLDPSYEEYFNNTVEEVLAAPQQPNDRSSTLSKRSVVCDGQKPSTVKININKNLIHLRNLGSVLTVGSIPFSCGRVSCSARSSIWWCNGKRGQKAPVPSEVIADSAQAIIDECPGGGQERHGDGLSIVKSDTC